MATNLKATVVPTARLLVEKGQLDRALEEYTRALGESDDPRIWQRIGDVHLRRGSTKDALAAYGRSAIGYTGEGFYAKAAAIYKQILGLEPDRLDVYLALAELYQSLGLGGDARRQLEAAVEMCVARGRTSDRLWAERKLLELDPGNVPAHLALADRLAQGGHSQEAAQLLASAARRLRCLGRSDDFLRVGERALSLGIDDCELCRMVAQTHLERGRPDLALERLRSAFEAHPEDYGTLELLASAFEHQGHIDRALKVLRALAWLLHRDGLRARRDAVYRRILMHATDDPDALRALGPLPPPLTIEEEIVVDGERGRL